jgi:hypothetical protein
MTKNVRCIVNGVNNAIPFYLKKKCKHVGGSINPNERQRLVSQTPALPCIAADTAIYRYTYIRKHPAPAGKSNR